MALENHDVMKSKHHTPEQVIRRLVEGERLDTGDTVPEVPSSSRTTDTT